MKRVLRFMIFIAFFALVGCTGETSTTTVTTVANTTETVTSQEQTTTQVTFEHSVSLILGDQSYDLGFDDQTDQSLLDLIEASDIHVLYQTSEYGAMITEIGDYKADDFHWIGFTKNDEFAMSGVDSIDYTDGDVFEFTENLSTWEISLTAELIEKHEDHLVFENQTQAFLIYHDDMPETIILDDLVVGFIYSMTGMVSDLTDEDTNVFSPSSFSLNVIDDFTDLYDIEEGDVFILAFTVTTYEPSSAFGYELFATDINGLSSTDISENMTISSITDYIFYTIPDNYNLSIGESYIGRFIYMVNEPSSIPQITLYEESITGASLSQIIVEE